MCTHLHHADVAQAFKVKYVTAYADRLAKLADDTTLRAQLASFPLATDSPDAILPEHRTGVLFAPLQGRAMHVRGDFELDITANTKQLPKCSGR